MSWSHKNAVAAANISAINGVAIANVAALNGIDSEAGGDDTIYHMLLIGQSNATGAAAYPILDLSPSAYGLIFDHAGHLSGGTTRYFGVTADDYTAEAMPPVALEEMQNPTTLEAQTMAFALAEYFGLQAGRTVFVSSCAVSGNPYTALKKGTVYYDDSLAMIEAVYDYAVGLGRPYKCILVNVHGEQDQATTQTDYAPNLAEWQDDYDTDIKVITGQVEDVVMFLTQQLGVGSFSSLTNTCYQAWDAFVADPTRIVIAGSRGPYGYTSPPIDDDSFLHLSAYAQRNQGMIFARAAYQHVVQGTPWLPLAPLAGQVTISGATITVPCSVPTGPMVVDNLYLPPSPDRGFFFTDDGAARTVTNVTIASSTLTITLSGSPTGTAGSRRLYGYAPQVRDSATGTGLNGEPLYNWMVPFREVVN